MIADRRPVKQAPKKPVQAPASGPGEWIPDALGLPPDCPVHPLGIDGDRLWFLDEIGQIRFMDPEYGKNRVLSLFGGRLEYLEWAWPRFGKSDDKTGQSAVNSYANEKVVSALVKACIGKGPWNNLDKVRGRGCWTDATGNLVIHTGTAVITGKRAETPGEHDGWVYPTRAEIAPPLPLRPMRSCHHWLRPRTRH